MSEIRQLIDDLRLNKCSIKLNGANNINLVLEDGVKLSEELILKVKKNKLELIEYLKFSLKTVELKINKVAPQEDYAISNAQRRLWILSQFDDASIAYNIPGNINLNQEIDILCFKRAIASAIARHEILRTVFKEGENGELRQWVLSPEVLDFKIDYQDYRVSENKHEKVNEYISEDSYCAFDLEKGPLLRASLLQLEDQEYVFYYNLHHIISDGWSMDVLSKDVFAYYEAYKENKEVGLKDLRIQYKDYSAWQLGQLEEESFKAHRDYWLSSLSGELPVLGLPGTKQRPRIRTSHGQSLITYIDEQATGKLKRFSEASGGTVFMGLLATWNVLIHRYTSQTDIITGSPIAGREHADLEDQIGFYVNTLALRNEVDPEESFSSFYKRLKDNTLKSYSHQMYPFDRLVDELELHRDTSRSAVFDVLLVLQNNGDKAAGVELKADAFSVIRDQGDCASKFDLELNFREMGDYLSFNVVYNPDVYEVGMVEGLMMHYKQLLNAMLEHPEEKVSTIDYLSAEEKHKLLNSFNDTAVAYPKEKTIVELFEEQVKKTPDKIAIVFEEKELSYKELNERSNQLADYLQKTYAIKPDDLVGIKQERSDWMIVSILGILKSGGAYVPVDPEYPQERIAYIEKDTKCKVSIDENELNRFKEKQSSYSKANPAIDITSNQLAYVIYTSGSTGHPKGVMIEHRNAYSFIKWSHDEFENSDFDTVLFTTSLNFDLSVFEIFHPLTKGKELTILKDGLSIINNLDKGKKQMINTVPSTVGSLLQQAMDFGSVSVLNMAGEPVPSNYKRALKGKVKEIRNLYGPSEDTTYSTVLRIDKDDRNLIGKPISNTQIYIVNGHHALQPVGVFGEICIGGAGLTRGYLNQPGLTKEKFISNPFKEGERLYKTGDSGRWLPDGNIEFTGRKDDQVKIRGYRIELGEIEQALLKKEGIEETLVLARENTKKEKELVAYIIAKAEQNASELRSYLKTMLPEYMLPAYYVQLERMPLNANGKIDKKSLPDPEGLGLSIGVEYIAPRNETEEQLVKIWETILQREHIGIKDDFFALGGHSLKAVRLINEYQKELGVKLSLKELFTYTSIEAHFSLIQSSKKTTFIGIEKVAVQESYAISNAQRRLWVLSQFEDGSVAYNMRGKAYFNQDIDIDCFKRAIASTIERHEILRTVFKDEKGEVRQWVLQPEDLTFKIDYKDYRRESNKQEKVKQYIAEDSYRVFDLEKGPLLRAGLLQLEDREYVFYYNLHHIISDGWSMDVLSKDVFAYYEAYKENKEPGLKELPIQYKDYSAWASTQLKEAAFADHRNYWLNNLSGELPLLHLPGSKSRPDVKTHNGRTVVTYFNKELTSGLKNYALDWDGTLFIAITAILKAFLYRYTGQEDLILGTPTAGRNHSDLDNQIGLYVNALALRTEISGSDSFEKVYQKVRHTILEAYTHQMYPFDRLVDELDRSRLTSRSAVFDVMVVLQNAGEKIFDLLIPEEKIDDITESGRGTCIYDIKFDFQEEGDYLRFLLEYNKDIYEEEIIEEFIRHFKEFAALALADSRNRIELISYSSKEKKQDKLADHENGKAGYTSEKTIIDLFQANVKKHHQNTAIRYGDLSYSYEELNKRANQVAHFLLEEVGIKKEEKVGLLLNSGSDAIAAILGVLKVGGVYVPLNPGMSEDRLLFIVSDAGMRAMITEKEFIEPANRLQWGQKNLAHYLCIDSDDIKLEWEHHENVMMSQELWDHVGERADDQITGGGWLNSYTGKAIPDDEMEEYSMNVYRKLKDCLHSGMRVLEIGCSSGITLNKIAPHVSFYYGTDLSPVIISNTKKLITEQGLTNVKLKQLAAHEISELEEGDFDLIIINSVIHNFHGHNYLLRVIKNSIALLKEKGRIFIGDIMDINKKKELIEDLEAFKRNNKGKGYTTKTDFSSDLFVSGGYFEDLMVDENEIVEVSISEKIRTIENELTKFRYDVVLHIDKALVKKEKNNNEKQYKLRKHKKQYSRVDLNEKRTTDPMVKIAADQLAYIIYTPVSPVKLKRVSVEHNQVVKLFAKNDARFDHKDVWTLFNSSDSDFSVWEIYGALFFGGKMVVVPRTIARNAPLYLELIEKEGVTVLNLSASGFYDLCKAEEGSALKLKVRCVIFRGETLNSTKLQHWLGQYPSCRFINIHEFTETAVHGSQKELTQEDAEKVLRIFNDTEVDYPREKTFVDLFEEQVEKTPGNTAVVFENRELNFKEFDELSNQLAHYLQKNYQVQPDDLVGIRQERSEWMLISVIAVLKAGGAYVPIDPGYPKDRIDYIGKDTQCKVCIDDQELIKFKKSQERYSKNKIISSARSNNLIYVIYTSGSTGAPKGVLIEHSGVVNRLLWMQRELKITEGDVFLQKTPITFDVSVWELLLPLISGSKLVIAIPEGHRDPVYLEQVITDAGVSIIHFVPSMLSGVLENITWSKFKKLRHVVCSGEALSKKLENLFKKRAPHAQLYNYYGPTEASVDVTSINLTQFPTTRDEVSIGKPIDNTHIYIVDQMNIPQGVGVLGEILIGGVQIARGYLNKKELTQEKFIESPFKVGERLYKTGDLGRWLPDGNIEFIGRKDYQVKIRGYRIELGEIEHVLLSNEQIKEAVVLIKEKPDKEKELVAYITASVEQNISDLRSFLKKLLPDYMLPSYYVQLEEMPLSSNGKIDRKLLTDPEGLELESGVEYVAPRNEIEEQLVKIWEAILQREHIGVKDDFFALGGHSLKAVRVINEYQKKLNVKLSLKELFTHTSIVAHYNLIQSSKKTEFLGIEKVVPQASYAISNAQRRLWILSQFEDGSIAYNMPNNLYLNRGIDIDCFKKAIASAIERHEILRTIFKKDEKGELRQWIIQPDDLGFHIDYRNYQNEQNKQELVQSYMREDSNRVFDLEKGPLLRAGLLQLEDREYVFYYNLHHIISDGWSMDVLSKDVFAYYEAYKENKEPGLKDLRIQYKDYSAWQLGQMEEAVFKPHKDYWLTKLSGKLPRIDLIAINNRPDVKTHNGRTVVTYFNKELTSGFKKYASDRNGTLFFAIAAALKAFLYRYTGQEDLIIGTPIAGRTHSDLEDQIGFYVNTLALRSTVSRRDSFDSIYQKVSRTIVEAYTHQMYPFDRLVEELSENRLTSRSAVFDIMLILQNTGERIPDLLISEEKTGDIIEYERGTCKYDIEFDFQEEGDYLRLLLGYNKDIYEGEIIEGFIRGFKEFISLALAYPGIRIASINCLTETEKREVAFIDTKVDYLFEKTIVDLLHEQVNDQGQEVALYFGNTHDRYKKLNKRSNQIARFLLQEVGVQKEEKVGLLLNSGPDTVACILGVLKAGAAYVPLDPGLSEEHLAFLVSDAEIRALITMKEFIEPANKLQWGQENLTHYLCIDSEDVRSEPEHRKNATMSQELWDHIGERAEDQITGGGWLSSYTGKAMPAEEMEEYSMNAYNKLKDGLHPGMRVLEIGCASGITLNKIAPHVAFYYGTDLSPVIISNTEKLIAEKGFRNVKLRQLAAHEISELEEKNFDLIIINSVIQAFHGHNYLLKVIRDSITLLKEQGRIFIGDVMDLDKKKNLIEDIITFKNNNKDKGYITKTDFSSDLFVARGYFEDLMVDEKQIADVSISEKIRTIENELTKFRYDVVLDINKNNSTKNDRKGKEQKKYKWQFGRQALDAKITDDPGIIIIPSQLASVVYAPDILGRPRGVMIEHHNIASLLKSNKPLLDFNYLDMWQPFHCFIFDYSLWQSGQLQSPSFKSHKDYWLNKLSGVLPVIDLPVIKQRPEKKTYNGQTLSAYIDRDVTGELARYSESRGGTVFMGLLAAWNVLVYRYTSQTDIIIGCPITSEVNADSENQVGFYINTLALRNEVRPEENFNKLFSRIKENTLDACTHQMYPFDRLTKDLGLKWDKSRHVLYDVSLTFHNNTESKEVPDDAIINQVFNAGLSKVKNDIELHFRQAGDCLSFNLVYNTDVYDRKMIESLMYHYRQLLTSLLENQEEKISVVNFLSEAERNELLIGFNDTEITYPKEKTIIDLFEAQVEQTPDCIAVVFEGKKLTYRELNDQSNQLAHYLRTNYAIQPDDLVGIKQERSEWVMISILGILKSGGAYVPIDLEYPQERIAFIAKDTNYKVCIDENELGKFVENQKEYSIHKLNVDIKVNDLAYVIYTSGSTGHPKGVMVEHHGLVNMAADHIRKLGLSPSDNVLQFVSFSFDGSILDVFMTFASGGTLVILSRDMIHNPLRFIEYAGEQKITVMTLPPAYLRALNQPAFKSIRAIITAGESANLQDAAHYAQTKDYYNAYGPTEGTVNSTLYKVEALRQYNNIPIGHAADNKQVYILNDHCALQPIGVTGEICISGAGLARGYLNQEELTKEKFIEDPFKKGEKLYKTGDRGRWLQGGAIEFIGRKDDQVKIRGYRIELGEIEQALLKQEAIEEAVVLARENYKKEKELVAYITANTEQNISELRACLKEILPVYMVPSYYVQLKLFPLTANGKIDRKSLPDPEGLDLISETEYVGPANEMEEKLVKIWQEVLQREHIGVKDDFFALGGHSLKAIRLINEYQKELDVKISLKELFSHSTIMVHAELIEIQKWVKTDTNQGIPGEDDIETFNF